MGYPEDYTVWAAINPVLVSLIPGTFMQGVREPGVELMGLLVSMSVGLLVFGFVVLHMRGN